MNDRMGTFKFFKESLKNIKTVGTFTRSSKFLCRHITQHIDFSQADVIIELGAGDGVITKHILAKMKPDSKLLAFEVNHRFCNMMRAINDPRLIVIEDSAEKLGQYLKDNQIEEIDYIVSAIPFVALPDDLGQRIVNTCHQYMKRGALFIQVHYSLLAKGLYEGVFGNVDINWVALNVPPAFVLVSEKNGLSPEPAISQTSA